MEEDGTGFGKFLETKRKEEGVTLRKLAQDLEIAPAYLSDIEKGRRYPPEKHLSEIARLLHLSKEERSEMYDLAARTRENQVSSDISGYIMDTDQVRVALRRAKESRFSNAEWSQVVDFIEGHRK